MKLWQALDQPMLEGAADLIDLLPSDRRGDYLHEYVQDHKYQREKLETQTQASGLSSDAEIQLHKQLRQIDKLIQTFERRKDFLINMINEEKRTPMDMIRPQFKGMKLGEIAGRVLDNNLRLLTTNELTRLIYDTKTDDEFDRARNSLSSELRSGVKVQNPRWKKVGRNAYVTTSGGSV